MRAFFFGSLLRTALGLGEPCSQIAMRQGYAKLSPTGLAKSILRSFADVVSVGRAETRRVSLFDPETRGEPVASGVDLDLSWQLFAYNKSQRRTRMRGSVWKSNFGRRTPSTRCCPHNCICSMAWSFEAIDATLSP